MSPFTPPSSSRTSLPSSSSAWLPGHDTPVLAAPRHHLVFGHELRSHVLGADTAYFASGCFWGAEKLWWQTPGVVLTGVGYLGGHTPNPTYAEVCTGATGHAEAVKVQFDPVKVGYEQLLEVFFEHHDPTQGMRQGNDVGTQYRSLIGVTSPAQREAAHAVRDRYERAFRDAGYPPVTTEIIEVTDAGFYFAEDYHQQYGEAHDRAGRAWYCPVHATGVRCGSDS